MLQSTEGTPERLWSLASVGHGGYGTFNPLEMEEFRQEVLYEFQRLSKVVARLLRLNIQLESHVHLVEIVGSQMLSKKQAKEVKEREVAMDQQLSRKMGIKSDRGKDDLGLQVVIPSFYGGHRHLITLILWVEEPGKVANISLKYKDLVKMDNAQDSTFVSLSRRPLPLNKFNREVREFTLDQWLAINAYHTFHQEFNPDTSINYAWMKWVMHPSQETNFHRPWFLVKDSIFKIDHSKESLLDHKEFISLFKTAKLGRSP